MPSTLVNGAADACTSQAPMSIFAQNNGVIALTRCANRGAGFVAPSSSGRPETDIPCRYWCASFLILYGVLAKISGVFLAIPNSVSVFIESRSSHNQLTSCPHQSRWCDHVCAPLPRHAAARG